MNLFYSNQRNIRARLLFSEPGRWSRRTDNCLWWLHFISSVKLCNTRHSVCARPVFHIAARRTDRHICRVYYVRRSSSSRNSINPVRKYAEVMSYCGHHGRKFLFWREGCLIVYIVCVCGCNFLNMMALYHENTAEKKFAITVKHAHLMCS